MVVKVKSKILKFFDYLEDEDDFKKNPKTEFLKLCQTHGG